MNGISQWFWRMHPLVRLLRAGRRDVAFCASFSISADEIERGERLGEDQSHPDFWPAVRPFQHVEW